MSLRFRLNLMIALTLLTLVGVGTLFVVHNARRSVAEEVSASVDMALHLVDLGLAHESSGERALTAWLADLARLEKIRHLRIQLRQPAQALIRLSQAPSAQADNRAPAWFAWAVTPASTTGEKQIHTGSGTPLHILVEANPADEVAEAWAEARNFLLCMLALAAAVAVLVHITLGQALQSVGHILRGLADIERGDYGQRLPRFDLPEFDRISTTFNQMAQALDKAQGENRALARHSLQVQEEERRYLAQELHDELGQSLSAIKAMAAALRNTPARTESPAGRPPPSTGELGKQGLTEPGVQGLTCTGYPNRASLALHAERFQGLNPAAAPASEGGLARGAGGAAQTIMDQCDRLFGVVRGMMRRLRPLMLDELGLVPSLRDMVDQWRTRYPEIALRFDCEKAVDEVAEGAKIHLFRIVQESLTNIAKHAQARTVSIKLELADDDWIRLAVYDDGLGFDPGQPSGGFGLRGIGERVASLDGQWTLTTAPGQGVALEILIPCEIRHA